MNLLAHALLSPDDAGILVGNITADWVKGRARRQLPQSLQAGMALHQRIDIFTDAHHRVEACVDLLYPAWGRYAPVLVDIVFDHVLSAVWQDYTDEPREKFIARVYDTLRQEMHHLPQRAQWACHHLLADDWLNCYATLDGIALSLTRVSSRLRHAGHDIELAPAVTDYLHCQPAFTQAFQEFFTDLRAHVAATREFSLA